MLRLDNSLSSLRAAGTKGCQRRILSSWAVMGLTINWWNRCLGSIRLQYIRNRVAPCRRSSDGWIHARVGKYSVGVGRRHPVTMCMTSLRNIVNEARISAATSDWYAVLRCEIHQGEGCYLQCFCVSNLPGPYKLPQQCDTLFLLFAQCHDMMMERERSV